MDSGKDHGRNRREKFARVTGHQHTYASGDANDFELQENNLRRSMYVPQGIPFYWQDEGVPSFQSRARRKY